ncbi:hypothetical protein [Geoglobus sp.]
MDKFVMILQAIEELNKVGSWSGNTHIQKTIELAQSLVEEDIYAFTLHHYGPFSFELREDLDALVGAGFVKKQTDEYGYHYTLTEKGRKYLEKNKPDENVRTAIARISERFGKSSTLILELISTIDYVTKKFDAKTDEEVAKIVKRLKPHFDEKTIVHGIKIWKEMKTSFNFRK